jgi:CheY-like chemotaxis protein
VFTLDASGSGQAAMLNETGCCNSVRNPAVRGKTAVMYATGEGLPLAAKYQAGVSRLRVKVAVGGVPAEVLWWGNVGIFQVNFRIPADAPTGDAVPLVLTVGSARSSESVTMAIRTARRQILIVADRADVRRRLAAVLSPAGYQVSVARDNSEAVAIAKDHNVDLVISDLAFPAADNADMMRAIRAARQQVKTAAVADSLSPEALRAADLLGAQVVLTSTLAAETVLQRVRFLLRQRPARY